MSQVAVEAETVNVKAEFNVNNIQYSNELWDKGRNKASQNKYLCVVFASIALNIIHQGYECMI